MAAVHAAETLRLEGFCGRVLLISEENRLPYDRPPLSKALLTGDMTFDGCLLRPASWYDEYGIDLMLGVRVQSLDPHTSRLRLGTGAEIRFDRALIATGARPHTLGGLANSSDTVLTLRTADDAEKIRAALVPGTHLAVIGGGFIGAELASSATALGCEVTMFEATAAPMAAVLGERIAHSLVSLYRANGIRVLTGTPVRELNTGPRGVEITSADRRTWRADAVVVSAGAVPNVELASAAGLRVSDGIEVDETAATSAPHVFAAGDVANRPETRFGGRVRIEHWQNAQNQGAAAARAMIGQRAPFGEVPWFWTDQFGLNMQVTGFPHRADRVVERGSIEEGRFAAYYLSGRSLVATLGVGLAGEVHLARRLIAEKAEVAREALADTGLRAAVRYAAEG